MINPETVCDLHIHSYYSDGNRSPDELVRYAHSLGLAAVSITDHDTLRGQQEALSAGQRHGIEVLTGVEFSVRERGQSLHILGYLVDHTDRELIMHADRLRGARLERANAILDLLSREGIRISFEEVAAEAGEGCIGRPHIARILLKRGVIDGIQTAFDRYIGYRRSCYVPKTVLPLGDVIRLIRGSGGVAVWAHPGSSIRKKRLVERLKHCGVAGIEVWHPNHNALLEKEIRAAAEQHGLICTGGSDFHFEEAMHAGLGEVTAPYASIEALKAAAAG